MHFEQFGNKYVVRLDKGEELVSELKQFCADQGITLGSITGIGVTNKAVIGLFRMEEKKYASREFVGDHEIASLVGNVTLMDGEVYLHLYATLGGPDNIAYSGHLNSAVISATCEIFIDVYDGKLEREKNEETGLNLIKFL